MYGFELGDFVYGEDWCFGQIVKLEEDGVWVEFDTERGGEPAWCEYLMWERAKDSWYPLLLTRKYYNDLENDAEVERRMKWHKEEDNA